jgi:hypothetical protein
MTALAARHIRGPADHVMRVPVVLVIQTLVALRMVAPEVPGTPALVALRMMPLVARHIRDPEVHAMRVLVVRATQVPGERAKRVQLCADDIASIQGERHLTTACRATRRKRHAPEGGR